MPFKHVLKSLFVSVIPVFGLISCSPDKFQAGNEEVDLYTDAPEVVVLRSVSSGTQILELPEYYNSLDSVFLRESDKETPADLSSVVKVTRSSECRLPSGRIVKDQSEIRLQSSYDLAELLPLEAFPASTQILGTNNLTECEAGLKFYNDFGSSRTRKLPKAKIVFHDIERTITIGMTSSNAINDGLNFRLKLSDLKFTQALYKEAVDSLSFNCVDYSQLTQRPTHTSTLLSDIYTSYENYDAHTAIWAEHPSQTCTIYTRTDGVISASRPFMVIFPDYKSNIVATSLLDTITQTYHPSTPFVQYTLENNLDKPVQFLVQKREILIRPVSRDRKFTIHRRGELNYFIENPNTVSNSFNNAFGLYVTVRPNSKTVISAQIVYPHAWGCGSEYDIAGYDFTVLNNGKHPILRLSRPVHESHATTFEIATEYAESYTNAYLTQGYGAGNRERWFVLSAFAARKLDLAPISGPDGTPNGNKEWACW